MAQLSGFSSSDRELLKLSPFWVFQIVSGVDGTIDEKEMQQFKRDLKEFSSELFSNGELENQRLDADISLQILESSSLESDELEKTLQKYSNNYIDNLEKTALLIDNKFTKAEAVIFKQVLINIGVNVADSSGGWRFLKNNISKLEASAINNIKKALRYN